MNKSFNREVGNRLFNARKQKGMTRAELGKIINLHESTIKRYEDGEIKSLDVDKMKDFAVALNCSPAYLMGWDDTPPVSLNPYIEKYYQLNDDNQQTVNNLIDDLSEKQKADDKFREALRELEEKNKRQALMIAYGGKKEIHEFTDEEIDAFHKYLEEYKSQNSPK